MRNYWLFLGLFFISLGTVACGMEPEANAVTSPTAPPQVNVTIERLPQTVLAAHSNARATEALLTPHNTLCQYPSGWRIYQILEKETAETIAGRFGLTPETLLQSNCLTSPASVVAGGTLYIPANDRPSQPQTILPLSVTAFVPNLAQAAPKDQVTLQWASQGNIINVRLGTLFNGQYTELAQNLPAQGSFEVVLPADGRASIEYVVIVSDGVQDVVAQTSVGITCKENWFFTPAPQTCPSPVLMTEFYEQQFERGTMVYVPSLGKVYVLVVGQEAVSMADEYIPGMPLVDPEFAPLAGYEPTFGAIHYIWRKDAVRAALGQAVTPVKNYQGIWQRGVTPQEDVTYLLASSGHIYRLGQGIIWGVIVPV